MGTAKGYLHEHGPRVGMLATQLGAEMGLDEVERSALVFAAVLSDMGMVGLAEDAWENPAPELSDEVRARVKQHPQRSEQRVREIPHLERLGPLIRHHHEWWDGSGYPDGLWGPAIPLGAQILRIADTVTALGADRPQRSAVGRGEVAKIVRASIGKEIGPEVAETFLELDKAGEIPQFTQQAYRHTVLRAAEHLLPEEVSPLSTDQLLCIVANLVDAKDPYTSGHSRRVAVLAVAVADQMGLEGHLKSQLWAVGYLHDLGKVAVPLRVLAKDGKLSEEEFAYIRAHPGDGARILERIPTLEHLTTGVRYHHERWDGGGYPEGLSGDRIPLVAQIMAVCDAYDAMTSKRAYRDSLGPDYAKAEVVRETGTQFAPTAAEAFLEISDDIFEGLHGTRPPTLSELPQRVQTLRHIDPRWFTSQPIETP
jgi:HD-GYP domain-containing protein (c-di-GMP phosphodiesterase class II)